MQSFNKILIFGGSFNPPHYGHLEICKTASEIIKPDKFIIVPNFKNPLKKDYLIYPDDKLKLCKIMFENEIDNLIISNYELENEFDSYFYLTLNHFKEQYPNSEIHMIIGYDQYKDFHLWKKYDYILDNITSCLVFERGLFKENPILKQWEDKFNLIKFKNDINSSYLRLTKIDSTLTKPQIINYINEKGLYAPERVEQFCSKHRFSHCIRVAGYGYYLACINNLANPILCYIAGLYHDIAKEFSEEKLREIAKTIPFIPKNLPTTLLHPYVGASFIEKQYQLTNITILKAIAKHTKPYDFFGEKPNQYEMILYIADKIEPFRTDADFCLKPVKYYRKLAETNLEQCFNEIYEDVQMLFNNKDINK